MYAEQILRIHTKVEDKEKLAEMVSPVIDFVNKHAFEFELSLHGLKETGHILEVRSSCRVVGRTTAYCQGMIAEVKQMLKEIFKCKIEVIYYAY